MEEPRGEEQTADTMRQCVSGGRPMLWFLVEGNRAAVAAALLAAGECETGTATRWARSLWTHWRSC